MEKMPFLKEMTAKLVFIEHHHVFSATSAAILVSRANLKVLRVDILHEASGKYTIAMFCS